MSDIFLYYDSVFQEHDTGNHPENAGRLLPSVELLNSLSTDATFVRPQWQPATPDRLQLTHESAYIDQVRDFAKSGGGYIEQDTVVSETSYDVSVMAAGAVCDAVEKVHARQAAKAFCLIRPPGHHAAAGNAAGFCLFNNVAVGARLATRQLGYQRVLIVDWDVHHGDGTQAIFWDDPQVGYFSTHRSPFYPFTGTEKETGSGAGEGTTRNVPFEYGTPRHEQLKRFENELSTFASKIKPGLVMISTGFDAHKDDPVGSLGLEAVDFATMTRIVIEIANEYANGKIVSVLEGGYNPEALSACVEQHLTELAAATGS